MEYYKIHLKEEFKMKNNNNGMTGGQKCFLAVVGLLVADGIFANFCKVKAHKNALKTVEELQKDSSDNEDEE